MTTTIISTDLRRQHGAALIIGLILLAVLTLIGVSAMQGTTVQERMAGNVRDKWLAFEAAEAGLRRGETFLSQIVSTAGFDGSGGQFGETDTLPNVWNSSSWTSSNSISFTDAVANTDTPDALSGVAEQPRYIIQHMGNITMDQGALNIRNYGKQRIGDVADFSITARGVGGDENTVVLLRSHYGKRL